MKEDVYSRLIKGMDGTAVEPPNKGQSEPYAAIKQLSEQGWDEIEGFITFPDRKDGR